MYSYFHSIKSVFGSSNGLYNVTDHLWWRDTNFMANYTASDGTKQKCYWSRGNGWAFVALARTWMCFPPMTCTMPSICRPFRKWLRPSKPCSGRMVSGT